MRKFLIVTALLSAMLMGLMVYSVKLINAKAATEENVQFQSQLAETKKEQLNRKKEELAQLLEEMGAASEDTEWIRLQEEVQQMEAQKADLEAQLRQITADTEALKEKLQGEDNDQSYFLEVYNALTKGLNDVKGYISGN